MIVVIRYVIFGTATQGRRWGISDWCACPGLQSPRGRNVGSKINISIKKINFLPSTAFKILCKI